MTKKVTLTIGVVIVAIWMLGRILGEIFLGRSIFEAEHLSLAISVLTVLYGLTTRRSRTKLKGGG